MLKPRDSDPSPDDCNRFLDFFKTKIDTIRNNIALSKPAPLPATAPYAGQTFSSFAQLTQAELSTIILKLSSSTGSLDPLPTPLLKKCLPATARIMTHIVNRSLSSGEVPPSLKLAVIKPVLKKHSLDPEVLSHYRPISNLPFLAKVLEKAVTLQLHEHLQTHDLYETFQSGFRPSHSTETALVRVLNDLLMMADSGSPSLLILLDLSAAFDTVDHQTLCQRLREVGVTGTALDFFHSYLTGRREYVKLGHHISNIGLVTCGVPQGSVLGPLLFLIYMLPLGNILRSHGICFHSYADDTQIYLQTSSDAHLTLSRASKCLDDIHLWMARNSLQLNGSKTEAILIGTPHQTTQTGITHITVDNHSIPLSSLVTSLGVKFDTSLSFDAHIKSVCQTSFYHLRNISKLRPSLSQSDAERLVHAFITSRIDYCNALLAGLPSKNIQRLQYVQNSAARVLTKTRKNQHITPVLQSLHWLPVNERITYKTLLLVYKAIHHLGPTYLQDLLSPQTSSRSLRSGSQNLLAIRRTRLSTMGDRAFCVLGPRLWNLLPGSIRALDSLAAFKSSLKTHLFHAAYH